MRLRIVWLCLMIASCADRSPDPPAGSKAPVRIADPCGLLAHATFRSVKEFDTGLGPDGMPALGKWTVQFRGPLVSFQISDTWRSAPYTCTNGVIRVDAAGDSFEGRYDATTRVLILNGVEYERVE